MNTEIFTQYFGVDWVGMVMTFMSLYYLGSKKWYGFAFGGASSIAWTIFSVMAGSAAGVIANVVFFFLNARGLLMWRKEDKSVVTHK